MPERIQRKRTKGSRMPKGAVYVGRPTMWGNPVKAVRGCVIGPNWADVRGKPMQQGVWCSHDVSAYSVHAPASRAVEHAVDIFRIYCQVQKRDYPDAFDKWVAPLQGYDLACWCPLDEPCHADVLLAIANPPFGVTGEPK